MTSPSSSILTWATLAAVASHRCPCTSRSARFLAMKLAQHRLGLKTQACTESQNVRGWQGPLWVTQPNPLPKQGHPEQAAQDLVQAGLEYLQRRRLHNLPGQPVPVLRHPQSEEIHRDHPCTRTLLPHPPICPTAEKQKRRTCPRGMASANHCWAVVTLSDRHSQ